MGLDMYLERDVYIGAYFEYRNVTGVIDLKYGEGDNMRPISIDLKKVSNIVEHVGYWRKANQIHAWFVQNCGGGEDDCQRMFVSLDNLKELLSVCERVRENHMLPDGDGEKNSLAGELLPPSSGFFFGSDEIDEWYWEQIEETIALLKNVIAEEDARRERKEYSDFFYQASW